MNVGQFSDHAEFRDPSMSYTLPEVIENVLVKNTGYDWFNPSIWQYLAWNFDNWLKRFFIWQRLGDFPQVLNLDIEI